MSFEVWYPFRESPGRDLRARLVGRRRFGRIRVGDGRIHLGSAALAPEEITEVEAVFHSWPIDPDQDEKTRAEYAAEDKIWLTVRTRSGRRYVSGPASLTEDQRTALIGAWRELCPQARFSERRKAAPPPLTSY
ncbi:hypothetical protein ACTI_52470 [Actinoplanes sp. OR16]|uniref:hypothetical protein n=1 Tax=Actinoplanes sp. OR16 TaxID=946334 RepID=UPI000F718375|nr:hypothetical protein [Actinoplanes sp. OR16]BBH68562.1 hypothetical protein ACTI_52470 [Actinoplanes sp. OR16]